MKPSAVFTLVTRKLRLGRLFDVLNLSILGRGSSVLTEAFVSEDSISLNLSALLLDTRLVLPSRRLLNLSLCSEAKGGCILKSSWTRRRFPRDWNGCFLKADLNDVSFLELSFLFELVLEMFSVVLPLLVTSELACDWLVLPIFLLDAIGGSFTVSWLLVSESSVTIEEARSLENSGVDWDLTFQFARLESEIRAVWHVKKHTLTNEVWELMIYLLHRSFRHWDTKLADKRSSLSLVLSIAAGRLL